MVSINDIQDFSKRLVECYKPDKVIIFGSRARGKAGRDSDVDILVLMPKEGDSVQLPVDMRLRLNPRFPLDLMVVSSKRFRKRVRAGDSFLREIDEEGKVLYEAPHR